MASPSIESAVMPFALLTIKRWRGVILVSPPLLPPASLPPMQPCPPPTTIMMITTTTTSPVTSKEDKCEHAIKGGNNVPSDDAPNGNHFLYLSVADFQELGKGRNRHTFYHYSLTSSGSSSAFTLSGPGL
mmetsp:Transcript_19506/g.39813  ORF Transcript_19506/g.39813 Transcript_19506/m.39813 type:complete len:130 (-) Transcript_19506:721-1110(-)